MPSYIVNRNSQPNGDHEVHKLSCTRLPDPANRMPLGEHASCSTAVAKAKKTYPTADGCAYCSPACHKR